MVSLKIEVKKKDFVWIIPLVAVLVVGVVYAYGTSDPVVFGHSAGELEVDLVDTNADTECIGTYMYLNGDGECRDVRADGDLYDTDTTVISGVLYGWCLDDSDAGRSYCIDAKSPAYCGGSDARYCTCPSGYTLVKTGYWTEGTSDFSVIRHNHYSCHKD